MQNVVDRFLRYVKFDTQSNEETADRCPSTNGQLVFAVALQQELTEMGLDQVCLDDNGYLTACLPATQNCVAPAMGWISHMDTAPDFSGANVNPQIIRNYQGHDIALGTSGETLSPKQFPSLLKYVGQDLITTDGLSLLGADDKSGIAEILTAVAYLQSHPEISHGDIWIGFTPDEEIGQGADHFPLDRFPAKWAYTVDGGEIGELEFENFNAAGATIQIKGNSVHPGTAKGTLVNASTLACLFHAGMPKDETPETTEGYEGFFHLNQIKGGVETASLHYIIRDFVKESFERRKAFLKEHVEAFNQELGENRFHLTIKDSYANMREKIEPHMEIINIAQKAMQEAGVTANIKPIRGGTDGARLSFMGLPCPNIFTGGHNFHGKFEYTCIQSMEKAVETLVNIAKITAK